MSSEAFVIILVNDRIAAIAHRCPTYHIIALIHVIAYYAMKYEIVSTVTAATARFIVDLEMEHIYRTSETKFISRSYLLEFLIVRECLCKRNLTKILFYTGQRHLHRNFIMINIADSHR